MFESVNWKRKHRRRFLDICYNALDGEGLDCLFGCEVGGHQQGLLATFRNVEEVFYDDETEERGIPRRFHVSSMQAYMAMWNALLMSWQPEVPAMSELRPSFVRQLSSSEEVEVQLVVSMYDAKNHADMLCYLIVGNMHIRTPQAPKQAPRLLKESRYSQGLVAGRSYFG